MPIKANKSKEAAQAPEKRKSAPAGKLSTPQKKPATTKSPVSTESESSPKAAPAKPTAPLSLIDDAEKPPRKKAEATAGTKKFVPLSKLGGKKADPVPASKTTAPALSPKPEKAPAAPVLSLLPEDKKPAQKQPAPEPPPEAPVEAEPAAAPEEESKVIHLKPPIIVKDLAAALNLRSFQVIQDLMELNIFANITQSVEPEIASKVCEKHGFLFEKERREKGGGVHKPEPVIAPPPKPEKPKAEELLGRAPIVTIMGHVDHGKTSLLDTIRKARVAASEAGGITQHIGAYSVDREGQRITFVDTPGHAAFTAMRARGASVTDIVVLVVAADDGLMPQTIEAINHAKAAGAPIIVAINKMDLASANPDKVKKQLQEHGLSPEDWGGDTICVPVSAIKGTGVDDLLSMILLQAEIMELKASREAGTRAIIIEAEVEPGRGPTATVIVKMGTLKVGQPFICGKYWGKVKQLIDDLGKPVKQAGPSTPVKVLGFSGLPDAGEELVEMDSERSAKALSEERIQGLRLNKLTAPQRATLENLFATTDSNQAKELRLVIKSDVQGSLEAIVTALEEIPSEKVYVEIIHAAVGPISESDVLLASASNAVIIGFGIKVENNASSAAKREGVQIKLFSIIYELIDQVKDSMAGMLDPEMRETVIGHAEVKQVFDLSKGKVGGCMVVDGRISRTARARVLRRKQPIYDGGIGTLKRFQDEVKEVRAGLECGIKLGDFNDYEPGDIIQCYTLEKFAQKL